MVESLVDCIQGLVKTWPLGAVDLMAESHHTHLEGEKESALDLASVKLDGRSDMLHMRCPHILP